MVHKTWSKRNGPTDTGQEPEVVVQDGRAQAAPMTSANAAPLPSAKAALISSARDARRPSARAAQAPGDQDESAEAAPTSPMTRADVPTVALAWLFLATRNAALIMIPIAHHPDPGAGAIISLREPEELFGAAKDSRREGAAQGAEIVASISQGARDRLPRDQRRGPRGGQKRGPKTWSIRRGPREVVQKDVVHDGVQDMVQVVVHETWSTRSGPKDVVQETGDMAQDGRAKALTKPRRCGAPKPLHYRAPRPLFYRAQKTLRCPAPEQHRPPATRTRAQKPLQRRR